MRSIPGAARDPHRVGRFLPDTVFARSYREILWAPEDVTDGPDDVADRLVAGDRDALAEAYRRWARSCTLALRGLQDQHEAEDITQQVFVAAWNSRHTLRPGPDAVPRWLVGIAAQITDAPPNAGATCPAPTAQSAQPAQPVRYPAGVD